MSLNAIPDADMADLVDAAQVVTDVARRIAQSVDKTGGDANSLTYTATMMAVQAIISGDFHGKKPVSERLVMINVDDLRARCSGAAMAVGVSIGQIARAGPSYLPIFLAVMEETAGKLGSGAASVTKWEGP